ncbi:MAG: flagellar biosynthetic protein FliO [Gammaproteobacteria bacterium]|nr:flagellar biosynthetic protein FliO [Gammaproteobacteria bacterium]
MSATSTLTQTAATPDMASGLATLGKVSFTLFAIIVFILMCAWLVRRFGSSYLPVAGSDIRIVASATVGPKEKVVIVDMLGKRVALGVTAQNVTALSESEIPADAEEQTVEGATNSQSQTPSFAQLLKNSLTRPKSGS